MSDKRELKLPYIEFDYNDDRSHDSAIKQGILYMVRIQKVFDQLGQLEITPEIVKFVREPHIRAKLREILTGESRFSLASPELPFLMRAELVDAYFQYRISQHLQQFDGIEIYLTDGEKDLFGKPIGEEVISRLGRDVDSSLEKDIRKILSVGASPDIYDTVFEGRFNVPDIAAAFHHKVGSQVSTALVPHVSSELTVSHLGGKDAISSTLFFHALFTSQPSTEKEKAIFFDGMRRILQKDGGLPITEKYNMIRLDLATYNSIDPGYRRVIHEYLMHNLMDAQKIQEVATMFPSEVPASVGSVCVIGGLIEAHNVGVRMEGHDFYFDNDESKSLESIAMGAQYLLKMFARVSGTALVRVATQSDSDKRRARDNVGFFQILGSLSENKMYWEREIEEITASNAFEFFEITDPERQKEFYNAYCRLFKEEGYEGAGGDEPWIKVKMKLSPDGSLQMAIVDEMHGDDSGRDWFDPFEYAKSDERGVDYFRRSEFDMNIDRLKESLDREIAANNRVKKQLALATDGKCPVRVDEGLYHRMCYIRQTMDQLARWDERIVALLPFVEQDYSAYMEMLGVSELIDRDQVSKVYHRAVARDRAHPDATQNLQEKAEKGRRLGELIRARDELLHKLGLQTASNASGVSMYIGNLSPMLKANQHSGQ